MYLSHEKRTQNQTYSHVTSAIILKPYKKKKLAWKKINKSEFDVFLEHSKIKLQVDAIS